MSVVNQSKDIVLRPAEERGHASHGWLDTYHSFSFADYFDPKHMGFRTLRVINEDRVQPKEGFGMHPHKDMEILTYVIEGGLQHKDSMNHASLINAGDVQKITAGTGILHSEFNASDSLPVHLLQIWIVPEKNKLKPSYQQFSLPKKDDQAQPLLLFASCEGGKEIIQMNQNVNVYRGVLKPGRPCLYIFEPGRGGWVQMIKGKMQLNGLTLKSGDGASIESYKQIELTAQEISEFLLFDLQ